MDLLISRRDAVLEHTAKVDEDSNGQTIISRLGSPDVRALDLRLDGRELNSRPPRLIVDG